MPYPVAAIILAAGYSSRMGAFKPLLPLGRMTVLERAITLFRDAGVQDIRVVAGYCSTELLPLLNSLQVGTLLNERYQEGMYSSVVTAAASIGAETEAFMLLPVDIPLVRHSTIELLLQSWRDSPQGIIYPTCCGKRGHPPLIAAAYCEQILAWDGSDGLRGLLTRYEGDSRSVECGDDGILLDMDTPDDYQRLQESLQPGAIPSRQSCEQIMTKRFGREAPVTAHCRAVAAVALKIAGRLNAAGCQLDLALIEAAALLHDLGKGAAGHAAAGAAHLRELGYSGVAGLVAVHMELPPRTDDTIDAAGVLFLADKLIEGTQVVTLETRFRRSLERHQDNPAILAHVTRRLENAHDLQRLVEAQLGILLADLLSDLQP